MMELPSLAPDGMAATDLMWQLLDGGFFAPEYDGLKAPGLWAADGADLYTRDKPITSAADLAGMILRSPSAAQANQIEKLGVTPQPRVSPDADR